MKHIKQLILASVFTLVGFAVLAPATASAAEPKKCHWDKKKGAMVCQRPPR